MPKPRTKAVEIAQRRQRVADLYIQGWTQMQIAEELSVAQSTVCTDLQRIQQDWRESGIRDFNLVREIELRKIDRLEREAWKAWERSQKPAQSAHISDETHQRKTRRHVRNQYGDPRFLEQINKCIASRRALLGLDAPVRTEVCSVGLELSLDERRDRIGQLLDSIRDRSRIGSTGAGTGHVQPRLPGPVHEQQ